MHAHGHFKRPAPTADPQQPASLLLALSTISGRQLGRPPIATGEIALLVSVQTSPAALVTAYLVRGARYIELAAVEGSRSLPVELVAGLVAGQPFDVSWMVKYKAISVFLLFL